METSRASWNALLLVLITSAYLGGVLTGCGGGAGGGGGGAGGAAAAGAAGAAAAAAPAPSMTLTLTNPATGATVTGVTSALPQAKATATLKDSAGAAVPNAVVTFSTDATLATFTPVSGTALTDAAGAASVLVNAASLTAAGAANLTATSQVTQTSGSTTTTTAVTKTLGFSVGATAVAIVPPPAPCATAVCFGVNPLSAFGTTSISVQVNVGGVATTTPLTVLFTSPCASSGKAVLTASVATVSGIATASYRDNGCAGTDLITATVSGTSASNTLTVTAPAVGSIQFVSASPTSIRLKGTGGVESSLVTFKVVDVGGNPIGGKCVTFTLNTAAGGLTLSNASAISDPTTGQVVTTVQSGAVSTPVRVTAGLTPTSPCAAPFAPVTLSTQSSQLTVTTGIAAQDEFSLTATKFNIEGLLFDGQTTVLTVSLADHFHNPVPDGTAVNFVSEGGSIQASCTTVAGSCTSTLTSQKLRPTNGRVSVVAFAIGEEAFVDTNGSGLADGPGELVDANGVSSDLGDVFLDFNEDGIKNGIEPFFPFVPGAAYSAAGDGLYNGILCNQTTGLGGGAPSSPGTCSAQKSIFVRGSFVIVFSGSDAFFNGLPASIALPVCVNGVAFTNTPVSTTFVIHDSNNNAMPVGTTITFSTTNGTITATAGTFPVPNTNACVAGAAGCPASAPALFGYTVTMKSDATQDQTAATLPCTNLSHSGSLSISVTTPLGRTTTAIIPVTD